MTRISPFARSYLRKRATDMLRMQCRIVRMGAEGAKRVYDPETRKVVVEDGSSVVYEGPCRYWEVNAGSKTVIGEQEVNVTQSWLSIPYNALSPDGELAEPEADDIVKIIPSDETDDIDPLLVGRNMLVVSVVFGGGLRASRRMNVEFTDTKEAGQ